MKNSLQTLIRLQKWKIDKERKLLVKFLEEKDKIEQNLENLIKRYKIEQGFYKENPMIGDFGAYTKKYLNEKEYLEHLLALINKDIEKIQETILEMFKEEKTYNIVKDRRDEEEKTLELHEEQKFLDEIGTNNYIKHQED